MMADRISREHRSWNMSRIRSENTLPERQLRSLLHQAGFRYRLHDRKLPGKPDIVLPKYRTAIFVNGCYWHRHPGCRYATTPKSNKDFWRKKFDETVERDARKTNELMNLGWSVFVIWECEIASDPLKIISSLSMQLREEI